MSAVPYVYTPVDRTSRRLGLFLLIVLGLGLTMMLFFVKTRAQDAREDVTRLEAQIEEHELAISVLSAEAAVLSNPERLRQLSRDRLALAPVTTDGTATLQDLEETP
ncbi:MAG: cell division protein FtsL [Litorimonas sp.]